MCVRGIVGYLMCVFVGRELWDTLSVYVCKKDCGISLVGVCEKTVEYPMCE